MSGLNVPTALISILGWLVLIIALLTAIRMPMPGKGPGLRAHRDPWRTFKYHARRTVLENAGHQCEAARFLVIGRCPDEAEEVDHVYPWSKKGPTIVSNGQALCKVHNRRKLDLTPPWWYVTSLERRRRDYFPSGVLTRVSARMTDDDDRTRSSPDR